MNLPDRVNEILREQDLTLWGAAHLLSAETDEPLTTAHATFRRYSKEAPKSWNRIVLLLKVLGYKVAIVKIDSSIIQQGQPKT